MGPRTSFDLVNSCIRARALLFAMHAHEPFFFFRTDTTWAGCLALEERAVACHAKILALTEGCGIPVGCPPNFCHGQPSASTLTPSRRQRTGGQNDENPYLMLTASIVDQTHRNEREGATWLAGPLSSRA